MRRPSTHPWQVITAAKRPDLSRPRSGRGLATVEPEAAFGACKQSPHVGTVQEDDAHPGDTAEGDYRPWLTECSRDWSEGERCDHRRDRGVARDEKHADPDARP